MGEDHSRFDQSGKTLGGVRVCASLTGLIGLGYFVERSECQAPQSFFYDLGGAVWLWGQTNESDSERVAHSQSPEYQVPFVSTKKTKEKG